MTVQFLNAIFDDSIKHANFFNGRILTATDLRDEQTATLKRARYLGQAAGQGVGYGLNVTRASGGAALDISSGLAVNRRGDALFLPGQKTRLDLVLADRPTANQTSPFVPCDIAAGTTFTGAVTTGYYLLALTSATRPSTKLAPHSGLNGSAGCTNRYEEVGVQLKLLSLTTAEFEPYTAPSNAALNRAHLAHTCLGTYELAAVEAALPALPPTYGLLDTLRAGSRLSNCDVPLAVFHFQNKQVRFVDVWAVRRPISHGVRVDVAGRDLTAIQSSWLDQALTQVVSPRRIIEAQAFLLQFQNQLEDLRTDDDVTPADVAAAGYFPFLPAAGYLPTQLFGGAIDATGQPLRRFVPSTFFGRTITFQELDPAYLRAIFHQSFQETPLDPAEDAINVYRVIGAAAAEPYVIFARRPRLALVEPAGEGDEQTELPKQPETGDLSVTVLHSSGGLVLDDSLIQSVRATNQKTGAPFTAKKTTKLPYTANAYEASQYQLFLAGEMTRIQNKFAVATPAPAASTPPVISVDWLGYTVIFNNLPTGKYTVQAITAPNYYSPSEDVTVKAHITNKATVTITKIDWPFKPRDTFISGEVLLPDGVIVDGGWFDPSWNDLLPGWQVDIPGLDPGNIDPPPDDWRVIDNPALLLGIESRFGQQPGLDPRVATSNPKIYVSQTFNPAQPADTVNAFVQTQDGRRFPLVLLAADNALDKPTLADRTQIPDYDRGLMGQLEAAGLARLDAVASAPTRLLAAVTGHSANYALSLANESRDTLQADFREGFMGYVGIDKAASDQLKEAFRDEPTGLVDKVAFANASPETIQGILGEGVGLDYAGRLLNDVQLTVPPGSYSLAGTSMSTYQQRALAEAGIRTNRDFRNLAATEEGRTNLTGTLGVSEATLNRYVEEATLAYAQGQFAATPEKSIATLDNMTPEIASRLAAEGVGSAKLLGNSSAGDLAARTGLPESELAGLVDEASSYASSAHLTLIEGATGGAVSGSAVLEAGFRSPGAIVNADSATLENITGLNPDTVTNIKNVMNNFLLSEGRTLRSFR